MDIAFIVKILPTIVSAVGTIKDIIDVANDNDGIVKNVRQAVPKLASLLEDVGGFLFPKAEPQLRIAAAVMTQFNESATKGVQTALNALLDPSPKLVVDGLYGPKTKAAVERFQAQMGLDVDGWAGKMTKAAIDKLLADRAK